MKILPPGDPILVGVGFCFGAKLGAKAFF